MNSVADELRQQSIEEMQLLSTEERIALALELGDFDLAIFCAQQNLEPAEGFDRLRRCRQIGRRASVLRKSIP